MLLADFFEAVYSPIRLISCSPRTTTLYDYTIRKFGETLGRPAELSDLNDLAVARHLKTLLDSGLSPYSVKKERDQLTALWNLAAKRRMVDQFPTLPPIKAPERIPEAWTIEEMRRLLAACETMPGTYKDVPAAAWWTTLILVLWETGERITAALNARFSDISGQVITFPAENRKGHQRANVCKLTHETSERLLDIKNPRRPLIWPWPYSETYRYHLMKKLLKRADLPTDSRSKFHRIRRSHATHLKINGGDPSASLCHSNPATTARYLDPRLIGKNGIEHLPKIC